MAKTKNTHAFQNDIKHYDKIRDILRYFYMYGSSSKEELIEKNLTKSISTFYDTKQRIQNYIDGEYFQEHKTSEKGSGKKFRFMYDPFVCPVNYLAETFQNCSYVIDDFIFYFCLLQAFTYSDYPQQPYEYMNDELCQDTAGIIHFTDSFTLNDLVTRISIIYETNQEIIEQLNGIKLIEIHGEEIFTLPKVRARVTELVDIGILVETSKGTFKLSEDIFEDFDAEELSDIQLMTQFFYNSCFLTIPGFYLSSTIGEYSQANFSSEADSFFNKQENPVFFYRNHRLQTVIDDDVTWTILNAIHNTQVVHYNYRVKTGEILEFDVLPMKIIIDRQYGRQYFFGYNYSDKNFYMPRISSITEISINQKIKQPQKFEFAPGYSSKEDIHPLYNELYLHHIDKVWNVALGEKTTIVKIHFSFSEDTYSRQLNRLLATRHHGIVTELGNGKIDFCVETKNELELVPWIRSFGSCAVVDKETNYELAARLKSDWEEALKQYGII